MVLVIGNKNYSSWSLRPWLAMKVAGIAFDERRVPIYVPGAKEELLRYLFGGFCAADALLALPALREWIEAAEREPESIPQFDPHE